MSLGIIKTDLLTFGYTREAQLLLPNVENPYYSISKDVTNLILSYIYNYFKNYGEYKWQINNHQIIKSFIDYDVAQSFESDDVEIAKILWRIQIYPNGDVQDRKGIFVVNLKPLSIDSTWDKIIFFRSIDFLEENYSNSMISAKASGENAGGWYHAVKLSELVRHSTITIRVTVNILAILMKSTISGLHQYQVNLSSQQYCKTGKTQKFTCKIDEALLKIFKAKPAGFFHSSGIFENMWSLDFYPNGDVGREGYTSIYLRQCFCISAELTVNYKIVCQEMGDEVDCIAARLSMDRQSWGKYRWFPSSKLANSKSLTLSVEVMITEIKENESDAQQVSDELQISNILQQSKEKRTMERLVSLSSFVEPSNGTVHTVDSK